MKSDRINDEIWQEFKMPDESDLISPQNNQHNRTFWKKYHALVKQSKNAKSRYIASHLVVRTPHDLIGHSFSVCSGITPSIVSVFFTNWLEILKNIWILTCIVLSVLLVEVNIIIALYAVAAIAAGACIKGLLVTIEWGKAGFRHDTLSLKISKEDIRLTGDATDQKIAFKDIRAVGWKGLKALRVTDKDIVQVFPLYTPKGEAFEYIDELYALLNAFAEKNQKELEKGKQQKPKKKKAKKPAKPVVKKTPPPTPKRPDYTYLIGKEFSLGKKSAFANKGGWTFALISVFLVAFVTFVAALIMGNLGYNKTTTSVVVASLSSLLFLVMAAKEYRRVIIQKKVLYALSLQLHIKADSIVLNTNDEEKVLLFEHIEDVQWNGNSIIDISEAHTEKVYSIPLTDAKGEFLSVGSDIFRFLRRATFTNQLQTKPTI